MSTEYFPTKHLIEKLAERNVTWAEVVDILDKPEVIYGPDYKGKRILQKGDLSVVVGADNAVLTVLLRDAENWTSEQARDRKETKRTPHKFNPNHNPNVKVKKTR